VDAAGLAPIESLVEEIHVQRLLGRCRWRDVWIAARRAYDE